MQSCQSGSKTLGLPKRGCKFGDGRSRPFFVALEHGANGAFMLCFYSPRFLSMVPMAFNGGGCVKSASGFNMLWMAVQPMLNQRMKQPLGSAVESLALLPLSPAALDIKKSLWRSSAAIVG